MLRTKTALQSIQIGCLLAAGQPEEVPAKLGVLIDEVEKQPSSFRVRWVSREVRHFVGEYKNLAAHHEWLEKLFDAIDNNDHDTMMKQLKDVRAKFKKLRAPFLHYSGSLIRADRLTELLPHGSI